MPAVAVLKLVSQSRHFVLSSCHHVVIVVISVQSRLLGLLLFQLLGLRRFFLLRVLPVLFLALAVYSILVFPLLLLLFLLLFALLRFLSFAALLLLAASLSFCFRLSLSLCLRHHRCFVAVVLFPVFLASKAENLRHMRRSVNS